jgi:FKBP-type peptidyl-prolyl cis-trans isomerase
MNLKGKELQSSYKQGQPLPITLQNQSLPPGLAEALLLMKVGGKNQVWLPPKPSASQNPSGEAGSMNETMFLEIELLSITPPQAAPQNAPQQAPPPPGH